MSTALDIKAVGTLIAAAAIVVGSVLGLFGSVLKELVPPSAQLSPQLYAGVASLAALLVLFTIIAVLPARLSRGRKLWVAGLTAACGVLAICVLLEYVSVLNTYAFRYPDRAGMDGKSARYVRGEFNTLGATMTRDMSVAAAIDSLGGLDLVRKNQLLWSERSQKEAEMRLVVHYVVAIAMLCAALFSFAAVVVRTMRSRPT